MSVIQHFIEVCEYGEIHAQCRCPAQLGVPKALRRVTCDGTHAPKREERTPTFTVNDLIEALSALGEDYRNAEVIAEGCDCANAVSGIEIVEDEVWINVRLGG